MVEESEKILLNLRKAQSHLTKITTMVESGQYCIDIMQQNLAVIGLLRSAHQMLMASHLNTCFQKAMAASTPARKKEMIQEILQVTRLANK